MSIFSTLGRIVSTFVNVLAQIMPILDLLKQLVPGLRDVADDIGDLVEQGGEKADDFVDNNRGSLLDIREFAFKFQLAGEGMVEVVDRILAAAEDDTITTDELATIYDDIQQAVERVIEAGEAAGGAKKAVEKLQNA